MRAPLPTVILRAQTNTFSSRQAESMRSSSAASTIRPRSVQPPISAVPRRRATVGSRNDMPRLSGRSPAAGSCCAKAKSAPIRAATAAEGAGSIAAELRIAVRGTSSPR